MPPVEKRIVELSSQDRHILEKIAKGLEKLERRPLTREEQSRRREFEEYLFGPGHQPYPRMDGDFKLLAPETFMNEDQTVISHQGENFYKACGTPVKTNPDGSSTTCIKRVGHARPTEHEDYDGRITTGFSD